MATRHQQSSSRKRVAEHNLAVELHLKVTGGFRKELRQSTEANMDSDYVFLCGVMWCRYGQQDAGSELLRAVKSADPDLSALALAMLLKGFASLQEHRNVNEPFARDKEEITAPLGS
jgi:hypothetical protein